MKHTPGKWKYVKTGKHHNNPDLENIEIQHGDDGECIADTVYEEADARLIAAAPEMLKILIAVLNWTAPDGDGIYDPVRQQVINIIEKATVKSTEEVLK
jgi:hypothetical protein